MTEQTDIADILGTMANGPIIGAHRSKIEQLMTHFHRGGLTLAICADRRHLGRSISTLKKYACQLSLKFPDYCPRHMKPKKPKGAKKAKAA